MASADVPSRGLRGAPHVRLTAIAIAALLGAAVRGADAQTTTTTLPPTSYLKCYKAKDPLAVRGQGPAWLELDSGGLGGESSCRIVGGFRLVCIPSSATLTGPLGGASAAARSRP